MDEKAQSLTTTAFQLAERLRKRVSAASRNVLKRPIRGPVEIPIVCSGQDASDLIMNRLQQSNPLFIGRMGRLEKEAICRHLNILSPGAFWQKAYRYFFQKSDPFWWDNDFRSQLRNIAGFFPTRDEDIDRLAQRLLKDLASVDILGVFGDEGNLIRNMSSIQPVPLKALEPYYHAVPWTRALKHQRVLVVHPFDKSIASQYARREILFANPDVLPEFDLITFKPVQSIAGKQVEFSTWFEALDWMCAEIEAIDFDIAIIGAGAYGFPLGSYIKQIGKKAVHLGGATQILFGIRGRRWDNRTFFRELFNDHWVRPLAEETPENFQSVEGGSYW